MDPVKVPEPFLTNALKMERELAAHLPTAYLTKEGEVVPAKKDVVAALNQLAAETDKRAVQVQRLEEASRAASKSLIDHLADQLRATVDRFCRDASHILDGALRAEAEAQLEVERLKELLAEIQERDE